MQTIDFMAGRSFGKAQQFPRPTRRRVGDRSPMPIPKRSLLRCTGAVVIERRRRVRLVGVASFGTK